MATDSRVLDCSGEVRYIVNSNRKLGDKVVRVFVGGSFDMIHHGHLNALRQAKKLGDVLVVGVHSDEEIRVHKGPPVMKEQERYKMIKSMKWVDEVIEGIAYMGRLDILEKYNCDFCAHGDDIPTSAGGKDALREFKAVGRYREYKRTAGVSTTDLVGRMLLMTKTHHTQSSDSQDLLRSNEVLNKQIQASPATTGVSSQKVFQFMEGNLKESKPGDKVVYVAGAFDLFHVGHVSFLEKCLQFGQYIIVGLHEDHVVNRYKGKNYPIMNLQERVLNVLACKYVSEVIIGAPYKVTENMMEQYKCDFVVHGNTPVKEDINGQDPYEAPKRRGIFRTIDSGSSLTTDDITQRIITNRVFYEKRNKAKEAKEMDTTSEGSKIV